MNTHGEPTVIRLTTVYQWQLLLLECVFYRSIFRIPLRAGTAPSTVGVWQLVASPMHLYQSRSLLRSFYHSSRSQLRHMIAVLREDSSTRRSDALLVPEAEIISTLKGRELRARGGTIGGRSLEPAPREKVVLSRVTANNFEVSFSQNLLSAETRIVCICSEESASPVPQTNKHAGTSRNVTLMLEGLFELSYGIHRTSIGCSPCVTAMVSNVSENNSRVKSFTLVVCAQFTFHHISFSPPSLWWMLTMS